jgi:hypothetical protein
MVTEVEKSGDSLIRMTQTHAYEMGKTWLGGGRPQEHRRIPAQKVVIV